MAQYRTLLSTAALATLLVHATPLYAETVFRLDASAPGEADPDKGIDYIGSVLAFNLYDALVVARPEWDPSRAPYRHRLEDRRQ